MPKKYHCCAGTAWLSAQAVQAEGLSAADVRQGPMRLVMHAEPKLRDTPLVCDRIAL